MHNVLITVICNVLLHLITIIGNALACIVLYLLLFNTKQC